MHKLTKPAPPPCLATYSYKIHTWKELSAADRTQIWNDLQALQGQRCAYCEVVIGGNSGHIEHFRQRNGNGGYPQGTFAWGNMFASCNHVDSCGKHKDSCGRYNHNDLIKMDVEDPDHFFRFVSDGTIALEKNLNAQEIQRAAETLRIFNLDAQNGRLRQMRKVAVSGHIQTLESLAACEKDFTAEEMADFINDEIANTAHLPHVTVIRHLFLK